MVMQTRKTTMTPRERMLRVLRRQTPDRVPLGYTGNAGINSRLLSHFGLADGDHEGLLRALGCDARGIHAPYRGPRLHAEIPGLHVNPEWGIRTRWIEHASGGYWDFCEFPLLNADDDTVANWPMPDPDDFDYDAVSGRCLRTGEYCLFVGGAGLGDIMNSTGMLMGQEQMLVNLAIEHAPTLHHIDHRLETMLEVARRTIEAAEGRIDFMWLGEDLGSQRGALISLDMFRRLIRPRHQHFVDLAKQHDLPVMIHSCGSSSWAFDDFIEMGIDAVDTLQPEAKDMSPEYLKCHFGDRLAFHGAISTAGELASGTVEDVERVVRETLRVLTPGGGYALAPTHAVQDNTPTENVLALFRAAMKYGWYE